MTTLDYANFPPLGDQNSKPSKSLPLEYRFPEPPVLENDERDGSEEESTSPQSEIDITPLAPHKPIPALQEETSENIGSSPSLKNSLGDEESYQDGKVASSEAECAAVDHIPLVAEGFDSRTISEQEAIDAKNSSLQPQRTPLPPSRYSHSRKTPHHYKNHSRNPASRNHRNHSQSSSSMQHSSSGSPIYHSDHGGYYYIPPNVTPYPPPVALTPNQPRFVLDEYGQPVTSLPVPVSVPIGLGLGSGTAYGIPFCGFPSSMTAAATTAPLNSNKNHAWMVNSPTPAMEGTPSVSAPSPRQSPSFRNAHPGSEYADYYAGGGYAHPYPHHPAAYPDVHRSEGYYYNTEPPYDAQADMYGYYHSPSQTGHPHHMQPHSPFPHRNMKPTANANVGISGGVPAAYHPNFYYSPTAPFANPTFARQNSTPPGMVSPAKHGTQPYNSRGNRRSSKNNHNVNGYSAGNSPLTSAHRATSRKNSVNSCGNEKAAHDQNLTDMRESRRFLTHDNDEIFPEVDKECSTDTPTRISLTKDDANTNEETNAKMESAKLSATRKCEGEMGNPNQNGGENERAQNEILSHADSRSNAVETESVPPSISDRDAFSDSFVTPPANISIMPVPTTPPTGGFCGSVYPNMRNRFPGTNVYIRGLPEDTTDEGLVEMCNIYGRIISSKAILEHKTGACRGFGFVMYADFRQARAAIVGLTHRGFQVSLAKCIPTAPSPRPYQNTATNSPSSHIARPMINTLSTTSSSSIPLNIHLHHPYLPSSPRPPSPRYPHHIPASHIPTAPSPSVRSDPIFHSHENEYGITEEQEPTVLLDPIPSLNVVAGHFHPERENESTAANSSSTTAPSTAPTTSCSPGASSTSILPTDSGLHIDQNPILNDGDSNPCAANTAQHLQLTEISPATVNTSTDGLKIHGMHEQNHLHSPAIVPQPRFTHPTRHCLPLPPCPPVSASAAVTPTRTPCAPRFVHNQGAHGPRYNACSTNPSTSRYGNNYQLQESFGTKLKKLQDTNSSNLYMSNLPLDMTEVGLEKLISPHSVISCRILCDTVMGASRGVGFARMRDREAALAVIAGLNGRLLPGSNVPLKVRFSDTLAQKKLKTQTLRKKAFSPNGKGSQGFRRQSKQDDLSTSSSKEPVSTPKCAESNGRDDDRLHSGDETQSGDPYVAEMYPERADAKNAPGSLSADTKKNIPGTEKQRIAHKNETPDMSVGTEKDQKPTMFFLAADGSVQPYPPFYVISGHDELEEENLADKSRNRNSEKDLEVQVESLAIR